MQIIVGNLDTLLEAVVLWAPASTDMDNEDPPRCINCPSCSNNRTSSIPTYPTCLHRLCHYHYSSSLVATHQLNISPDRIVHHIGAAMAAMYSLVVALAFLSALLVAHAADPDPLQDFCVADLDSTAVMVNGFPCKPRDKVTAKDFTWTGFRKPVYPTNVSQTGATADLVLASDLPGLNTMGVSHARLDFAVGGVIPLHTHPRASETLFVVKGSVYTGFISEDNVLYASTLQAGDFTVFPRALSHFQLNVGNDTATTFNTLTSQSPGFLFTANQMLVPKIPNAVIERSFGINSTTVEEMRSGIPRYWG